MSQTTTFVIELANEAATEQLAQSLANFVQAGDVFFLTGELGAGKTTFTRHFARALGVTGRVKSPTYTLVESYELAKGGSLHHFDLYRLSDPREWFSAGFDEYINPESIVLIEWPSQAAGALPEPTLTLAFEHGDEETRKVSIHATEHTDRLTLFLKAAQCHFPALDLS